MIFSKALNGHKEIVKCLADTHRADVNAQTVDGVKISLSF